MKLDGWPCMICGKKIDSERMSFISPWTVCSKKCHDEAERRHCEEPFKKDGRT